MPIRIQKAKWNLPTDRTTNRPTDRPTDRQKCDFTHLESFLAIINLWVFDKEVNNLCGNKKNVHFNWHSLYECKFRV